MHPHESWILKSLKEAILNAVLPTISFALTSAPSAIRASTAARSPWDTALNNYSFK
jgi:hypothetical protein